MFRTDDNIFISSHVCRRVEREVRPVDPSDVDEELTSPLFSTVPPLAFTLDLPVEIGILKFSRISSVRLL